MDNIRKILSILGDNLFIRVSGGLITLPNCFGRIII